MLDIYVDGDACPVKQEIYKVAGRYDLNVFVVSGTLLHAPKNPQIRCIAVGEGEDAADDWIAERIQAGDLCITADIPLAARCLAAGAYALDHRGKVFSEDSIGEVLAMRDLMSSLRESGMLPTSGPPPMTPKDRSRFLNQIDQMIQKIRHTGSFG